VKNKIWLVTVLALVATPVFAQDEARARNGLEGFLGDVYGKDFAPERLQRDKGMDATCPGAIAFTWMGELTACVDSSNGDVKFYSRFKPLLYVFTKDADGKDRSAEDRAAEIEKRARFTLDEDVKRAQDLLAAHYAGGTERVFEVTSKERIDQGALVMDDLVFTEKPREGVLACWPNRIDISMNPENGTLVTYIADDHRAESNDEPRLDKEAARKAALEAYGSRLSAENRAWIEKEAPVELVADTNEKGPCTAWRVGRVFVVDAETGACRPAGRR